MARRWFDHGFLDLQRRYPFFRDLHPNVYKYLAEIFSGIVSQGDRVNVLDWEVKITSKEMSRLARGKKTSYDAFSKPTTQTDSDDIVKLRVVLADLGIMDVVLPRRIQDLTGNTSVITSTSMSRLEVSRCAKVAVYLESICPVCRVQTKLSKCAQCCGIAYCSKKCQRMDWNDHKSECTVVVTSKVVLGLLILRP